jgi:ABC-2 type transport system ATP-binding protein
MSITSKPIQLSTSVGVGIAKSLRPYQQWSINKVTQYIEEAEFLADRVAFLDNGRIVAIDSPSNLIAGLGQWAVDIVRDDFIETVYFRTKEEAKRYISFQNGSFSLRRVNLEDAFLQITGKRVGSRF